ncbi:MAG: hypothetical protein QF434_07465 [Nitrospinaceae bacterium]|jgi:hypothetical protein|nr:hypothetical protein [Nitrospinaceae bacterium]|tara:strand:- start:968 stop:1225 length:258 start_codon:yes stop_codon:yes gene_type:complete
MAKKNIKGQINFFRFMAVIGVVVIIFVVNEFFNAAPGLPISTVHNGPPPTKACLGCHVKEAENTPIMPHRPMDNCIFCHKPSGKK